MRFNFQFNSLNTIAILFVVNMLVSGFVIGLVVYTFQKATEQRDESTNLTKEIHQSDIHSEKLNAEIQDGIATRQNQILINQKLILETLKLHYNQTANMLQGELREPENFHTNLNITNLAPLLDNKSRLLSK